MLYLAQVAPASSPGFDLLHAFLASMIPCATALGAYLGKLLFERGKTFVELKLKAAGHEEAAAALDAVILGVEQAGSDAVKAAIKKEAEGAGVQSHLDDRVQKLTTDGRALGG